jgi:hypothetical protein
MGDISARSALTIHRGTTNHSEKSRPVRVLGVDALDAFNGQHHEFAVTRDYWQRPPQRVQQYLKCPIVDQLQPNVRKRQIEGLMMGGSLTPGRRSIAEAPPFPRKGRADGHSPMHLHAVAPWTDSPRSTLGLTALFDIPQSR